MHIKIYWSVFYSLYSLCICCKMGIFYLIAKSCNFKNIRRRKIMTATHFVQILFLTIWDVIILINYVSQCPSCFVNQWKSLYIRFNVKQILGRMEQFIKVNICLSNTSMCDHNTSQNWTHNAVVHPRDIIATADSVTLWKRQSAPSVIAMHQHQSCGDVSG